MMSTLELPVLDPTVLLASSDPSLVARHRRRAGRDQGVAPRSRPGDRRGRRPGGARRRPAGAGPPGRGELRVGDHAPAADDLHRESFGEAAGARRSLPCRAGAGPAAAGGGRLSRPARGPEPVDLPRRRADVASPIYRPAPRARPRAPRRSGPAREGRRLVRLPAHVQDGAADGARSAASPPRTRRSCSTARRARARRGWPATSTSSPRTPAGRSWRSIAAHSRPT